MIELKTKHSESLFTEEILLILERANAGDADVTINGKGRRA
jgi:hypothetical protein